MPSVPREKYPEMNWRAADKVAAWKVFRRRMEVIFVADQIPEERQWALILVAGGDEAYNRWDTLEDTVQDRKKVEQVWKALEKSFEQSTSFWHFRDTYLGDFRQDESETTAESSSQPSSNASSPETSSSASTSRSTSPELLQMERSFNSLLAGTRDRQSHPVMRSQMDNLRDQQQRIAVLKQVASQPQNQPRPVSAPPVANMPLPPYPRRRPSDKGSKSQVQAENANAPRKSSDSENRLQDIQEEPRRRIGPSRVKELAKFFTPTSDEEENSRVNNRTRRKKLFEPKREEESEK